MVNALRDTVEEMVNAGHLSTHRNGISSGISGLSQA